MSKSLRRPDGSLHVTICAATSTSRASASSTIVLLLFRRMCLITPAMSLGASDIAGVIRHILRNNSNTIVELAEAREVDVAAQIVTCSDPSGRRSDFDIPFDYLVVASGTRHSYFGHPEWESLAPGLKGIEDALEMRRRFL